MNIGSTTHADDQLGFGWHKRDWHMGSGAFVVSALGLSDLDGLLPRRL